MVSHEIFMQRCIQLAKIGEGNVAPNPMVGAVIVLDGKIIGEGYHQTFGEAHAEVNAINSVQDKSKLSNATIYVSLEPCAHFGKTPPCANLIVEHNFKKVVIGSRDPHSKVDGKGISILTENNIEVITGVLEKECNELNRRFFTFHKKERPFVFLKWAETKNGRIDNGGNKGDITWISCKETKTLVHKWRNENQAILVGRKTVENDDPTLTVREVSGTNPIRIIIDPQLNTLTSAKVYNKTGKAIVINLIKTEIDDNIEYVKLDNISCSSILKLLFEKDIQSVLIEGGKSTLQSFIDSGLWDEAKRIIGNNSFEKGTAAPEIKNNPILSEIFFEDQIITYQNK